jgi:prevent-host-death family protein
MEDIGIFEAKTKFPGVCDQVVRSGLPVVVSRRGKPLVVISPVTPEARQESRGILDDWTAWEQAHPESGDDDFPEVWKLRYDRHSHPFEA